MSFPKDFSSVSFGTEFDSQEFDEEYGGPPAQSPLTAPKPPGESSDSGTTTATPGSGAAGPVTPAVPPGAPVGPTPRGAPGSGREEANQSLLKSRKRRRRGRLVLPFKEESSVSSSGEYPPKQRISFNHPSLTRGSSLTYDWKETKTDVSVSGYSGGVSSGGDGSKSQVEERPPPPTGRVALQNRIKELLEKKENLKTLLDQYFGLDAKTWQWKIKVGHKKRVTIPQLKNLINALQDGVKRTADDIVKQMGETEKRPNAAARALAAATQPSAATAESAAAATTGPAAAESAAAAVPRDGILIPYNVDIEVTLIDVGELTEDKRSELEAALNSLCEDNAERYFDLKKEEGYDLRKPFPTEGDTFNVTIDSKIEMESAQAGHFLQAPHNGTRRVIAIDEEEQMYFVKDEEDTDASINLSDPIEHVNFDEEHRNELTLPLPTANHWIPIEPYARVYYRLERKCDVFLLNIQKTLYKFGLHEHENYTVELHAEIFNDNEVSVASSHNSSYEGSFIDDSYVGEEGDGLGAVRQLIQGKQGDTPAPLPPVPTSGAAGPPAFRTPVPTSGATATIAQGGTADSSSSDSSATQLYPATIRRMSNLRF